MGRDRYTQSDSATYTAGTVRMLMGAYRRNLANTIEPPMCGGDAAFCQITLTTCYHYY